MKNSKTASSAAKAEPSPSQLIDAQLTDWVKQASRLPGEKM